MCFLFSSSVTQSCPKPCDHMDCSMPAFPVHHKLPELTQTHVHPVGDAIQPSHPLSSPSPPAFNLSRHQGLFFFFFIYFYYLEANYFTTLQWVLSYIDMNQPWSYKYSPSRSPLPPPSPPNSSGSSQCTRSEHLSHASHLGWWSVSL